MPTRIHEESFPPMSQTYKFSPLQRAWIDDLKAGRFNQGKHNLAVRQANKKVNYCCLGVACVVINRESRKLNLTPIKVTKDLIIRFDDEAGYLPESAIKTLGLRSSNGVLKTPYEKHGIIFHSLSQMNDRGWTHREIGEYIEQNPFNVFAYPFTQVQLDWLAALKSGKFKQGIKALATNKNGEVTHCCLGVACEVLGDQLEKEEISFGGVRLVRFDGEGHYLSQKAKKLLNMRDDLGNFSGPVNYKGLQYTHLAHMNDAGVPHSEIALFIESNPELIFTNHV